MHYESVRHCGNPSFICEVRNNNLDQIDPDSTAELVGTHGAVALKPVFTIDEIKQWAMGLGYYLNDDMAPRNYHEFDTGISLYPDNEEMILIYNSNTKPITISLINSKYAPTEIVHWNTWNLYDDIWVTVFNNNFDPKHAKSIIDAINFSQENKNLYRPARINHVHHYKLFPRHPLHTACMFSPKQYITEMKTYNKDKIPEHGKLIAGISNRIFNEQYEREFILLPNQLLILDQIITQWKIVQGDQNDLKMIPLWFKTNLRKHFNYSV